MLANIPLILIKRIDFEPTRIVAQGVLVSPMRSVDISEPAWRAWLLGGGYKEEVECKVVDVTNIATGLSETGQTTICQDERQVALNIAKAVVAAAANLIDVEIYGIHASRFLFRCLETKPKAVFLSRDAQLKPCSVEAIIHLMASRMSDFSDVSAFVSFLQKLEVGTRIPKGLGYSDMFREAAHNMRPKAGLWLPIEIQQGEHLVRGVVRLDNQISEDVFASTFFLGGGSESLQVGSDFRRLVKWNEHGRTFESVAVIGKVLSMHSSLAAEESPIT